jgi:hypothetical protein
LVLNRTPVWSAVPAGDCLRVVQSLAVSLMAGCTGRWRVCRRDTDGLCAEQKPGRSAEAASASRSRKFV